MHGGAGQCVTAVRAYKGLQLTHTQTHTHDPCSLLVQEHFRERARDSTTMADRSQPTPPAQLHPLVKKSGLESSQDEGSIMLYRSPQLTDLPCWGALPLRGLRPAHLHHCTYCVHGWGLRTECKCMGVRSRARSIFKEDRAAYALLPSRVTLRPPRNSTAHNAPASERH
eukprot:1139477-Pelagomonas_calceolata.AAC.8